MNQFLSNAQTTAVGDGALAQGIRYPMNEVKTALVAPIAIAIEDVNEELSQAERMSEEILGFLVGPRPDCAENGKSTEPRSFRDMVERSRGKTYHINETLREILANLRG